MRTILRQLATDRIDSKKVRDFLWSDYERRLATASIDGFDPPELRTKDSVELILELADQEPLTIVVIDDIDHTHEDDCHTFIEPLNRIIARSSNVVKILVTSRDNAHISTALTAADKTIRITSDEVRQDIETFVNHQIDGAIVKGWLFGNVSPTLRSMVQQALLGSFRWIRLRREKIEDDVVAALQNKLPKVSKLYDDTLAYIFQAGNHIRDVLIKAFSLVLYTVEPLNPPSFLAALAMAGPQNLPLTQLVDICPNLVL
ncbi:hypothetical protein MGN70_002573 [Eutypa lata]|nr:hypothetical protein MGN70_002573 [Eutypa lata]